MAERLKAPLVYTDKNIYLCCMKINRHILGGLSEAKVLIDVSKIDAKREIAINTDDVDRIYIGE